MRSSSANPSAGAERALSPAGAAGTARPAPAGLAFREIDESPAGLAALGRFYRERYVAAFPDPDERESLANMRHYLALKAAGWYGPNNYHVVIAEVDGEPVGGVVFDYLAAPNAGVIEFLFVAGAFRSSGLGRALLDEAISILRDDARARRGRRLTAVVAEMNDPFHRPATPDNLDPFLRAAIWGRWGFHALGFPYVQPALSAGQQKVEGLLLIVRPLVRVAPAGVRSSWIAAVVADYLRWAMRIDDPTAHPDYRAMVDYLAARPRIPLHPLQHYIGEDPERAFGVEEIGVEEIGAEGAPETVEGPEAGRSFDAALALARAAIPAAGRVAAAADFGAALAAALGGGPPYHLWALRAAGETGAGAVSGMASFFTLPSAGFGGYIVLAGALRGRGLLPLLLARIERRMMADGGRASGWFIECGEESAAAFLRCGFAEVPLEYRPPAVGSAAPAGTPERLRLLYKPFGLACRPSHLEARFVLRALREILRGVYGLATPARHPCYRLARASLAPAPPADAAI